MWDAIAAVAIAGSAPSAWEARPRNSPRHSRSSLPVAVSGSSGSALSCQ